MGEWPDFVFDACYTPMPLDELRTYLNKEHHLPGIPSAAEVDANNGVELGDLQRRLLQVVEEQALYILQLEDRVHVVEGQAAYILRLEARLKAIEQRLDTSNTPK